MPPKAKKQKTKHSRPRNPGAETHFGGHGRNAKLLPSQPGMPGDGGCICLLPGRPFPKDEKHHSSRYEGLPVSPGTAFLKLSISNLYNLVEAQGFDLESARARHYSAARTRQSFIEQHQPHVEEQKRLDKQRKLEEKRLQLQRRTAEEERFRKQAAIRAAGFLSFNYGRTIEERTNVGSWPIHQLVSPRSTLPQTNIVVPLTPANRATNVPESPLTQSLNPITSSTFPNPDGDISPVSSVFNRSFLPVSVPVQHSLSPTDSATSNTYYLRKLSVQTLDSEPPTPTDTSTMSDQPTRDLTGGVNASIKDLIQQLFFLQQHLSTFRNDKQAGLVNQAEEVARSIGRLEDQVSRPDNPLHNLTIAPEIIDYVEDGRNPDIYTRDFVELVQRGNSVMNGKQKAFRDFSKIYAQALKDNFDGLDDEVDMIMAESGFVEKNGKFVEKGLQNGNSK